jgi:hypothetical protein
MKAASCCCPRSASGYLLVEYMIYLAMLAVIMEVAFGGFYRFFENSHSLARNGDDIIHALKAGELWRSDIRQAIAAPELVNEPGLVACEIPQRTNRVAYIFADHSVWRKDGDGRPVEILAKVKEARVVSDRRHAVIAWRWEIELLTRRKNVHLRPLFTFEAVPGQLEK